MEEKGRGRKGKGEGRGEDVGKDLAHPKNSALRPLCRPMIDRRWFRYLANLQGTALSWATAFYSGA